MANNEDDTAHYKLSDEADLKSHCIPKFCCTGHRNKRARRAAEPPDATVLGREGRLRVQNTRDSKVHLQCNISVQFLLLPLKLKFRSKRGPYYTTNYTDLW
jgi:hypothetical protein